MRTPGRVGNGLCGELSIPLSLVLQTRAKSVGTLVPPIFAKTTAQHCITSLKANMRTSGEVGTALCGDAASPCRHDMPGCFLKQPNSKQT